MALSPKHATSLLRQCGEESLPALGERRLRSLRSQRIEIDVLHCNALLCGWSRQSHWEEAMYAGMFAALRQSGAFYQKHETIIPTRPMADAKRVAVIGGGISGAVCASTLCRNTSFEVTVFDQGRQLGGRCGHRRVAADGTYPAPVDASAFAFDHGCQLVRYAASTNHRSIRRDAASLDDEHWKNCDACLHRPRPAASNDGRSALHAASSVGHVGVVHQLLVAGANGHVEVVCLLLEGGRASADKEVVDNQHRAASSAASSESNMETVRLLLDTGPNAEAQMWQTAKVAQLRPRHVPGVLQAGHAKIVRLLLEARANKGVADKTGRTELITAGVKGRHLIEDQFFRADDPRFRADLLENWKGRGLVEEWVGNFGKLGQEHEGSKADFFGFPDRPPFYCAQGGMSSLPAALLEEAKSLGATLRGGVRVASTQRLSSGAWLLRGVEGPAALHDTAEEEAAKQAPDALGEFDAVIVTDVSASMASWHRASAGLPESLASKVRNRTRVALFTALVAFEVPLEVEKDAFAADKETLLPYAVMKPWQPC
ncbi:Kinase D-interacting substrate of 220 kDa [Symbiodinium microadriaticum]|uniref:Kinase D-interacting substrate of 220 kDa n=1 Tax=Symbiodinium microadriaticum TaxID=2951 RepID=A0A1Q9F5Z3_SYMMI|nr:Kinase D-interacting substrate of 220 kDa [Symbiodinium microadriaticum]